MSTSNPLAEGAAASSGPPVLSSPAVDNELLVAFPKTSPLRPTRTTGRCTANRTGLSTTTIHLQRRVKFSDAVSGVVIPPRARMSAEEKRCIWYCNEDTDHFKECIREDAEHMRQCRSRSISTESDGTTARGMEHLTSKKAFRKLYDTRVAVVRAVLVEQHQQRTFNSHDPMGLAVTSSVHSLEARKAGVARALADQEFALQQQRLHERMLPDLPLIAANTTRISHSHTMLTNKLLTGTSTSKTGSNLTRWSALRG